MTNPDGKNIKLISYYLPQFYETPENNKWWGKGFTEWTNTSKAMPLYTGHYQPRIPLENRYYDLSKIETQAWQIEIAKKYGLYGFSYYHYWFKDGQRMLEKPEQQLLANPELDFPFCLCWANEAWSRRWDGSELDILMEQDYGGPEQWKTHFMYLLPYFKDKRYIHKNGGPVFIFYRPELIECLNDMMDCWNELAVINDISKITYIFQHADFWKKKHDHNRFDYGIETQPGCAINYLIHTKWQKMILIFKNPYIFLFHFNRKMKGKTNVLNIINYHAVWRTILKTKPKSEKAIPCAFVDWDNSPRVGKRALIFKGSTPATFKKYLTQLIRKTKKEYKTDLVFINAWNEWAEGAYLEPDEKYRFAYLEAIRCALVETNQ